MGKQKESEKSAAGKSEKNAKNHATEKASFGKKVDEMIEKRFGEVPRLNTRVPRSAKLI